MFVYCYRYATQGSFKEFQKAQDAFKLGTFIKKVALGKDSGTRDIDTANERDEDSRSASYPPGMRAEEVQRHLPLLALLTCADGSIVTDLIRCHPHRRHGIEETQCPLPLSALPSVSFHHPTSSAEQVCYPEI